MDTLSYRTKYLQNLNTYKIWTLLNNPKIYIIFRESFTWNTEIGLQLFFLQSYNIFIMGQIYNKFAVAEF